MAQNQPPVPTHVPGTAKGEELVLKKGREPGRYGKDAPSHRSTRDATSINAGKRDPIDPKSPNLPPA